MEGPFIRCLMVETGEENTVIRLLKAMDLGRGICPRRVRVRKIRGAWRKDHMRLLPGYVFLFQEEDIPVRYIQRVEHVLKVLRYDREPEGYLHGDDLEFASLIRELDGKLDILEAVDEEGFIRVTDALLKKLHGEVISVDKGKHLVKIRVNLVGQERFIYLNYTLLDDEGNPLDPVAEMLDDEEDEWLTAWTPDFSETLVSRMDGDAGKEDSGEPEGYWEGMDAEEAEWWRTQEPEASGGDESIQDRHSFGNGKESAAARIEATDGTRDTEGEKAP